MKSRTILSVLSSVLVTFGLLASQTMADDANSSPSFSDYAQSSDPAYQFIYKKLVIGGTTRTARAVTHVHDSHLYLNEGDFEGLIDGYHMTVKVIGLIGSRSFPAYEYRIEDPYLSLPKSLHPFQPTGPVPDYAHLTKVTVNGQYVGSVTVISVGATYPHDDAAHTGRTLGNATFDDIRDSDLMSLFKVLRISNTLTPQAWTFASEPSGIEKAPTTGAEVIFAGDASNSLLPINVKTNQEYAPISIFQSGFHMFSVVAITPDGKMALALDGGSNAAVYPIDLVKDQALTPITVGGNDVTIAPDGKTAYVVNSGSVSPIDLSTLKPGPDIQVGGKPLKIDISPDGKMAYVVTGMNMASVTSVTPIDLTNGTVKPAIPLSGSLSTARGIFFSGTRLYALTSSPGNSRLVAFDPATGKQVAAIKVVNTAHSIAVSPDGKTIYVMNFNGTLTAVDLVSNSVKWTISLSVPGAPKGTSTLNSIQFSPDGQTAYVLAEGVQTGDLLSVDLRNHKQLPGFAPVGSNEFTLTLAPDQAPIASFASNVLKGGSVQFDATGSTSEMPIVKYKWDFGDGISTVSSDPIVKHKYAKPGSYTVTLTETDSAGATVDNPIVYNGHMALVNAGSPSAHTSKTITI